MPKTKKLPHKITPKHIAGIAVFLIGMVALAGVIYSARTGATLMGIKASNECATCKQACKDAFPQERGHERQTKNYENCLKTCKKGVCKFDPEATPSPVGITTPDPSGKPRERNKQSNTSEKTNTPNSGPNVVRHNYDGPPIKPNLNNPSPPSDSGWIQE